MSRPIFNMQGRRHDFEGGGGDIALTFEKRGGCMSYGGAALTMGTVFRFTIHVS